MSLVDQELFLPLANSFANLDVCNLFKQANLAPFCRESASCPLGPYLNDVCTILGFSYPLPLVCIWQQGWDSALL